MLLVLVSFASAAFPQTLEWSFETEVMPAAPTFYPDAAAPAGIVTAAAEKVMLLNGTGKLLWTAAFEKSVGSHLTVADLDGAGEAEVVFTLANGEAVCLEHDGGVRWRRAFHTQADAFAVIAAGDVHPASGLELVFGFMDGWLNCLGADGDVLWRFRGGKFRLGPPAIADVDGDGIADIVYGTDNGDLYCLTGMGAVKWRYSEFAPYGRSGVNLADLDGDGSDEVLITRSNTGIDRCLMALDAATGAFKWRTADVMQSYCSNALADLDEDGKLETFHADKGNWLYCTNADGTERWRTELAGRGIFWAPAIADLDGDGALEIVVPMRDTDATVGASHFVVGPDGAVITPLKLGSSGNAAPAIGDIDGDGELELIVSTKGPNAIQALSWGGAGKVAWPSLRGDSAMTARGNLEPGVPGNPPLPETAAPIRVASTDVFLGDNVFHAQWEQPVPENAFAEVAVRPRRADAEIRILPLHAGATEADLAWRLIRPEKTEVTLRVMASQAAAPIAAWTKRVAPKPAWSCDFDAVEERCMQAIEAGDAAGAATRGLRMRLEMLAVSQALLRRPESGDSDEAVARQATALRKEAAELAKLAGALEDLWKAGHTGSFVCWEDMNPWDRFDPEAIPETLVPSPPLKLVACGNEHEDLALNLLNISPRAIDLRCAFIKPELGPNKPAPVPELAKRITLRRSLRVPSHKSGMVNDALPELDRSQSITLPPGETRQLWLVVNTYGLEAATHELTLYLGSLENPMTLREIPITIEVLPIELPIGVYAQMNWAGVDINQTSGQQLQDMIDHGISVAYGPSLPTIPLDAQGNVAGEIDWRHTGAGLDRVPPYFQLLFPAPPGVKWPEGLAVEAGSELEEKGFATAVREMVKHMQAKGFGYERWAYYPYDEPWLTGFTIIPQLRAFCERVRRADPKVRNYTDPTGLLRVEYVDEFKDLIDIWQPEINILKRDPKLVKWFQDNAPALWAYEATDPGKDLLPLGYYRGYAWLAWRFGLDGAGFWCYKYYDIFWPLEQTHWSVVYQNGDEVIPSRRWEAVRDGQEDYRLFYVLRQEIDEAKAQGRAEEAQRAQALLDEALENVVAWQVGAIDEITRQTRDYELDYALLMDYRMKIAEEITRLRGKPV